MKKLFLLAIALSCAPGFAPASCPSGYTSYNHSSFRISASSTCSSGTAYNNSRVLPYQSLQCDTSKGTCSYGTCSLQ